MDIGVMPISLQVSECTDYKAGALAIVACACPTDSPETHSDTWEWGGACCLFVTGRIYSPSWAQIGR